MRNNGGLHREEIRLQSFSDASYPIPSLPVLQMDPLPVSDIGSFKVAFEMQTSIDGLDIVSMPEVSADITSFDSIVGNWCASAEDKGLGAAVQLSLSEDVDSFSERLDVLSEYALSGAVQVINIRYTEPSMCRQQLASLWARRDRIPAILNCTEVRNPRAEIVHGVVRDVETSLLQNGFDMITKRRNTPSPAFIGYLASQDPITSTDDMDRFNVSRHAASAFIKSETWNHMEHPPECRCSICRGNSRTEILNRFGYLDNGEISKSGMRYFSILHDHQSDMEELDVFREYTSTSGTAEYNQRVDDNLVALEKMTAQRCSAPRRWE